MSARVKVKATGSWLTLQASGQSRPGKDSVSSTPVGRRRYGSALQQGGAAGAAAGAHFLPREVTQVLGKSLP